MRQVLIPVEIPEKCDLPEALRWLAYREYPSTDQYEGMVLGVFSGSRDLLGRKTPNLDEKLFTEIPEQIPETQDRILENVGNYEKAISRLISLLNTGQLKAKGRWSGTHEHVAGYRQNSDWWNFSWDVSTSQPTDIPAADWTNKGAVIDFSLLKTPRGEFQNVEIATNDLFGVHEEEKAKRFAAEQRGKYILSIPGNPAPRSNPGGRPSKIKAALLAEVIRYSKTPQGLPEKQDALIQHLWKFAFDRENVFGVLSPSTIRDFVRDLYAELQTD